MAYVYRIWSRSGFDNTLGGAADRSPAPMRECEIFGRSHLDQARGRALELARLVAFGSLVKGGGLRCSGGKKLHAGIVKGVDQHDETFGFVAVGVGHDWHAIDDDRVEFV